jgi:hypothetical protein
VAIKSSTASSSAASEKLKIKILIGEGFFIFRFLEHYLGCSKHSLTKDNNKWVLTSSIRRKNLLDGMIWNVVNDFMVCMFAVKNACWNAIIVDSCK